MASPNCEKKAAPCAGCPWLAANQTPEAVARSPQGGKWFAHENLETKWRGVAKDGHMLPCHETDSDAASYGGVDAKPGHGRLCVGLSILAKREIVAFMIAGNDAAKYRKRKGLRMTLQGLASWASRLLFPGAVIDAGYRGQWEIPSVTDDPRVTVPWRDDVLNPKES